MLDRNHLAYPTHLIALVSPKFDFHLLLHNHSVDGAQIGGITNVQCMPSGHFDIMSKKI